MTTLRAYGDLEFIDVTNQEMYELRGNQLSMTSELDTEDLLAFPGGGTASELQTFDTIVNSTTWTFSAQTANVQKDTLQLIFRKRFATTGLSPIQLPFRDVVQVPAAPGPYTVTVSGYTTDETVYAKALSTAANGGGDVRLTQIDNANAGTIASGEIAVDSTTLTFHSAQAGATVVVTGLRSQTPNSQLGGTNTNDDLGTLSFYGLMKPKTLASPLKLYIPSLSFTEGVDFASDGDSVTFGLNAQTVAPYTTPFVIWD